MNAQLVPAQTAQQSANALVPRNIAEALELANVMSAANLIPEHLRGKPGDCLLIVMQAQRWGMDAVSVAQATSVVRGKLCYEGKLVAAALYAMGAIDGRLRYEFSGAGDQRRVKVSGTPRGTKIDQTVEGTVADWRTSNDNWKKSPDDMLVYRGTRQWARRYAPEALLGVYTPDEMEAEVVVARVVSTEPQQPQRAPYPAHEFESNLPKWRSVIESGKRSADEIIAMVESKGDLTAAQRAQIKGEAAADQAQGDAA